MNKVILIGNLGRDPEISNSQNGIAVTKFSMATSEKWKDKITGKMQERTEWHFITTFGRLAEICNEYLFKGKQVCIEGRIQTRSWEKDGVTRYTTEIIASMMKMLGTRFSDGDYNSPKTSETPLDVPADSGDSLSESEEDDIPF